MRRADGPLHNRVTPFGDIVAIPQCGLFTGNRGIIHDPATKTLLRRRGAHTTSTSGISCRRRQKERDVPARRCTLGEAVRAPGRTPPGPCCADTGAAWI